MKKLLFACAMTVAGAFAVAGASPASAMTAGAVTGINDIVTSGGAETVGYYWHRRRYCWEYPWRCRRWHHRRYWRHHHYHRPWWW